MSGSVELFQMYSKCHQEDSDVLGSSGDLECPWFFIGQTNIFSSSGTLFGHSSLSIMGNIPGELFRAEDSPPVDGFLYVGIYLFCL